MALFPSMGPVWLVARQQWTQLLRERRLRLLAILVAALCVLALATSLAEARRAQQARLDDMRAETQVWEAQGAANPHGAAHFGRYVYKPVQPLAVLDPGLLAHLGGTLKLEGHVQNTSRFKSTDGGAALTRFTGFNPAFAMQVLVPLLVVFAAFGAFSGERARQLLWQETGAGAAPWQLLAGRFGAFAAALMALAGAIAAGTALATLHHWSRAHLAALGLMLAAYAVYWLAFLGITLAISAWAASARVALLAALGFWATTAVLAPMLAPALAEQRYPTPGATAFHAKVDAEVMLGPDGHSPRDVRFAALERATLAQYGVVRVDDLPINYSGLLFEYGERTTAAIYNRHFERLYDDYARQAAFALAASAVSPLMAMRALSSALAQSDLPAHRHFLTQAEAYRYSMVQALNRDIKLHRKPGSGEYASDVAAVTGGIRFAPQPLALDAILPRIAAPGAMLLAWLAGACVLMGLAARNLEGSA
jgi:ABC-2 type transport system permease protein